MSACHFPTDSQIINHEDTLNILIILSKNHINIYCGLRQIYYQINLSTIWETASAGSGGVNSQQKKLAT